MRARARIWTVRLADAQPNVIWAARCWRAQIKAACSAADKFAAASLSRKLAWRQDNATRPAADVLGGRLRRASEQASALIRQMMMAMIAQLRRCEMLHAPE